MGVIFARLAHLVRPPIRIRLIMAATSVGFQAAFREEVLIEWLQTQGYDAIAFRCYPHDIPKPQDTGLIRHFPSDGPVAYDQLSTSAALTQEAVADKPDIVVIRAADYAVCHTTVEALPETTAVILICGGESRHAAIDQRVDYVLQEYEGQADPGVFPRLKGISVFPKFVNWSAVETAKDKSKVYDIVNVGSFEGRKNHTALLSLGEKFRCCFVGSGPLKSEIEAQAASLNSKNFDFVGQCSGPDVYQHIASSRIMVHPSTYEGFPRVFAESLAMGVPVVALKSTFSRVAPVPGIFLTEIEELSTTVDRLLSRSEGDTAIEDAARAYAVANYQTARIFGVFLQAVKEVKPRRLWWQGLFTSARRERLLLRWRDGFLG